jgi:hypothetical protein
MDMPPKNASMLSAPLKVSSMPPSSVLRVRSEGTM